MKKVIVFCLVLGLLSITNYVAANPTYSETLAPMQILDNNTSSYIYHTYQHTYDGSVDPLVQGLGIGSATLTIDANDVDGPGGPGSAADGEQDPVSISINSGSWIVLGDLQDKGVFTDDDWGIGGPGIGISTTVFNLGGYIDLTLLEGPATTLDVKVGCEPYWGVKIETSELVIVSAIPAPGAILLGSLGVGLVGWLRRRRTL